MDSEFKIELQQQADYRFEVRFDHPAIPSLITDEPPPLGRDAGPNPARLLATAVANCLAASLLFALRKFRSEPRSLGASAVLHIVRNAQNRLRIGGIEVELRLGIDGAEAPMLERALAQFEDFVSLPKASARPFR